MTSPDKRDDEYEHFKWTILGEASLEDDQGLWEPLWHLRSRHGIRGLTETERRELAERALRELYAEGLIYLFRGGEPGALDDPARQLDPGEVDEALRGDWWRGDGYLPDNDPDIWWGSTEKGDAAFAAQPVAFPPFWESPGGRDADRGGKAGDQGAPG